MEKNRIHPPSNRKGKIHDVAAPPTDQAKQEFKFLLLHIKILSKYLPCGIYNNKQEAGASDQFQ